MNSLAPGNAKAAADLALTLFDACSPTRSALAGFAGFCRSGRLAGPIIRIEDVPALDAASTAASTCETSVTDPAVELASANRLYETLLHSAEMVDGLFGFANRPAGSSIRADVPKKPKQATVPPAPLLHEESIWAAFFGKS